MVVISQLDDAVYTVTQKGPNFETV